MKSGKLTNYAAVDQKQPNYQALKFSISQEVRVNLLSDKGNLWALIISLALIVAQIAVIGFYFRKLPPQIPIFYSTVWGDSMMGRNLFIVLLPVLAIVCLFLNIILYFLFFRDNNQGFSSNRFLSRVLFLTNLVVSFCTFWGSVKIVTLLS